MRASASWAIRAVIAVTTVSVVAACGSGNDDGTSASPADGQKLSVVATTPEVADFVRNVGGDGVQVTQLIKPNVDPHEYEPTPADIQAIGTASVVVKNGVGMEKWLDQTIDAAGFDGTVVDTSQGVTLRKGDPDDEEMAEGDPHIWHNPLNAKIMAENIEKAFVAADSGRADTYRKNYRDYAAKLDALDAENTKKFDALPADQRKLVTNHDAFGYYIDRYRLEFVGSVIPSMDTSAELSASQLTDLVAKIKATGTKAIFSESSLPPKSAEAIAQQAGVKVVGGEDALYGDSLGTEGTPQGTYIGAEEHNTDTIVKALGG
ncbi:metal ABC transporter substrate-binding protein [Micromonospora sp. NBC_01796]|uniref:metal ABC transporter substrate-binding protein n=1 Tax=Micromonospora sp. NBC_01796 TaxID=2975987 RepID=UPI002DDBC8E8|nr:metal ABC transporter substrate-binding protein [Micromonospora sp. NBC_01796]WSA86056.1 metal ABC transporter substrate-binding protein [Micromonospora sp. NBC_01796]